MRQQDYSLVEKQATLEATKSSAELAESDQYAELTGEIAEMREGLSDTLGGIENDDDFIATLRGLDDGDES